ncbi:hypothetical protein E2C01_078800 [Portunus trituberculatus]|uniref:Uncharacterized protein n=1 Tax=Portunus trituberculatus TaxID=210409 RepID=A0A5B7IV33_PORTR|nr:hypothetical protein [Portunus trituberculatus]
MVCLHPAGHQTKPNPRISKQDKQHSDAYQCSSEPGTPFNLSMLPQCTGSCTHGDCSRTRQGGEAMRVPPCCELPALTETN